MKEIFKNKFVLSILIISEAQSCILLNFKVWLFSCSLCNLCFKWLFVVWKIRRLPTRLWRECVRKREEIVFKYTICYLLDQCFPCSFVSWQTKMFYCYWLLSGIYAKINCIILLTWRNIFVSCIIAYLLWTSRNN